jgi:hypothetical protein
MRAIAHVLPHVARYTLALALLVLAVCAAVQAQETPADQPAGPATSAKDDDDGPPRAAKPEPEPEARSEREDRDERRPDRGDRGAGKPYGQFRRLDKFDAEEEVQRARSAPVPGEAEPGVVVCLAGCNGPSGAVVFKK